jgi:agmatine deiminase
MNKFVTVAAIQTAVLNNLPNNLGKTVKLVEKAAQKGAQIICLQELYKTPYFPQYKNAKKDDYSETIPGESTKVFSAIAKKYKVVIIVPIFEKDKKRHYHNSAVVINTDGKLMPTYRKIHIPQDPLFYEKNYFEEGDMGYKIYKTKYAIFAVLICYDQWFPEAARAVKLAGADIIFYPTAIGNVKGVKETEGDWHDTWETIMRSHAITNSLHVVAVNRVGKEDKLIFWGQSFFSDAFGKIIKRGSKNRDEIIISKIDLGSNKIIENEWGFMRNRRTDTYQSIVWKK